MNIKNNLDKILNGELHILYGIALRKYLIGNNILGNCCNVCKITEWNNKPITLEIEHIDGDKWNNKRDNLELLCPNCHSQTATYRGKNITKNNIKLSLEQELKIIKYINEGKTIRNILLEIGLTGEGANYQKIYNILEKHNINYKDIRKKYSPQISNESKLKYDIWLENKKKEIKEANINFKQWGWRIKVAQILGYTPQATKKWIIKHIPELLCENNLVKIFSNNVV